MNAIKTLLLAGVLGAGLAAGLAAPANAAWYAKYDGVEGEATSASFGRGVGAMQSLDLTTGEDPVAVGLLLPAVQKVRAAAGRSEAQGRPKSFSAFEISNGRKTWTLHDATATPNGPNRVKILFRCKDWSDARTGETGSDCPQRAGKKGGKVETTWKVEEGE